MSKKITYRGTVTKVYPGILQVEIRDETACDACSVQKSCCMSGAREKRIDIPFVSGDYHPGDKVTIRGKISMGLRATLIAFVLPLTLILVILLTASSMGAGERQAAVLSLSAMVVYYIGIYFFRNKLKQTFTFMIE
ncbi:MAG: SoxR reducing system RseC family protein [Dysgonamonadaceae bacterium]|jgi:sigma-E factor negative regulatory protein RseC|nr:SoxR reducing system RseC family protein [Dysgonamonadaceae bacterium]